MLAYKVEPSLAVRVGPQPSLAAVESGAALGASRRIPERDGDVIAVNPLPIGRVLRVSDGAHPILAAAVAAARQTVQSVQEEGVGLNLFCIL